MLYVYAKIYMHTPYSAEGVLLAAGTWVHYHLESLVAKMQVALHLCCTHVLMFKFVQHIVQNVPYWLY